MLSGEGYGQTVDWDFFCSGGNNSGKWAKIAVPSNWELQGFGEYTYGRWYKNPDIKEPSQETGIYRYSFFVPVATIKNKLVQIVFEGVMTDTEVKINGKLAGDVHQGGFYRFSYDITKLLKSGQQNLLEVKVSKHSSDKSVNAAERRADWWLFGGIYRPVYLEIKPNRNIKNVAVDARYDGALSANIFLSGNNFKGENIDVTLVDLSGNELGHKSFPVNQKSEVQHLDMFWDNIRSWNCETPILYNIQFSLMDGNNHMIHKLTERIGFRTVEFKKHDGLYVNNTKVVLKGINRHSFWPDGGRTTNRQISLLDARLIKEMNMNAVRSHYPPDKHFLEICDSLGLFVIDELAGWQNSYKSEIGAKLVKEMIVWDVNHPSVILWSNGNEGGWNKTIDPLFGEYDIQQRHVIHPWADFDGLDTHHYPEYQTGIARFTNGNNVFMPTEFMHGLYDQGHGAGLEDFWEKYEKSPLFAGGFLWDFSDNSVRRVDRGRALDSDGDHAADGILGPYREKEASYYSVREIWSPIRIKPLKITPSFSGDLFISNGYLFSDLSGCALKYNVSKISDAFGNNPQQTILYSGKIILPEILPSETKKVKLQLDDRFFDGDVLEIIALDKSGNEVCTRTFPIKSAEEYLDRQTRPKINSKASVEVLENDIRLKHDNQTVIFDAKTGLIKEITNNGRLYAFRNGPIPVGMPYKFEHYKVHQDNDTAIFTAYYSGMLDSIRWTLNPAGILSMNALMLNKTSRSGGFDDADGGAGVSNFGFTFSCSETNIKKVQWFGRGISHVWKNRIAGTNYGLWQKNYNNTITGEAADTLIYPQFKGYHANMYWCRFFTEENTFTVYSESDNVFLRLFTPEEPKGNASGIKILPDFPEGDISFLYEIPAIRDFKPIQQHGPQSQPASIRIKKGDDGIRMILLFDFSKP